MKTSDYLDALRVELKLPSDYALMKVLGLSKSMVSCYRQNSQPFSDPIAMKVAELLKKQPAFVVLDMRRQSAKTEAEFSMWDDIFSGFHALLLHANRSLKIFPAR
jgi:hypothetical protein